MEKITIRIPANLKPSQEVLAIAKALEKKLLTTSGPKLLGNSVEVKDLNTTIVIEREPLENVTKTLVCSCCNTIFEKSIGRKLYVNYGGLPKVKIYCSDRCADIVIEICGEGRASKKRLSPAYLNQKPKRPCT